MRCPSCGRSLPPAEACLPCARLACVALLLPVGAILAMLAVLP
jgi:uncharacterized OB-fold protein